MNTPKRNSAAYFILLALIFFQGISGLYGGGALVLDPTGGTMKMPLNLLDGSPFNTYLIPGLILFVVLGMFPIIVLFGLLRRNVWAWRGALLVSVALIIWIGVEIAMIGYHADPPLQLIYGLVGVVLLVLTQLPSIRKLKPS